MLDAVTPVLLTHNEAANIGRTLSHISWANDVVVVDSGSTDETITMLAAYGRLRVFRRPFDTHHAQWRYAMESTGIRTPWVLRLDADYQLSDELIAEIAALDPDDAISAYSVSFDYAVFSRRLASSLYPPKAILLRQGSYSITDEGHTEGWSVSGAVAKLKARAIHDDWKRTPDWVMAQARYMTREHAKLQHRRRGIRDWLRMHPPLAPIAVFFYCLVGKRLILNGKAGLLYALQRATAEAILALFILEDRLRRNQEATLGADEPAHIRASKELPE